MITDRPQPIVACNCVMKYFIPISLLAAALIQGCATPPPDVVGGFSDDSPALFSHAPATPAESPARAQSDGNISTPAAAVQPRSPIATLTPPTQAEPSSREPRLRPGIQVSIEVMTTEKKEVSEPQKRVSAAGTITLPLVGTVAVNGMTVEELCARLTALYSAYLRTPVVDVTLVVDQSGDDTSPWGYVTVLGRVKTPGRISIPPTQDLTLSMAIQLAGGLDSSSKETDIRVQRRSNDDTQLFRVDLRQIGTGGDAAEDIRLLDGDVVYVPERIF